ncbi:pyridoxal-dependent decarboxylase [Micromonospora narathiwatensis]|uniref:Histidine decarboxylase n=1 Tax=Micromonospora narathiwatensis TaxID=299146 RepID=A0A1A8Z9S1_9ACTN|nr:pyridoxal-dependent decarboxylase [Micromonospora narathiwatensis]SBT40712.1 histidine decarboxylase [Micromonospora narathiwatensis]
MAPLLDFAVYNSGDADSDPAHLNHAHDLEREAVSFFAGLFRAPERWWGCVTSSGADATLHALHLARARLGAAAVYHSAAAHPSVPSAARLLGLHTVVVAIDPTGEMDYDDLTRQLAVHRGPAAIVVATIGTPWTDAADNVAEIHQRLDQLGITRRHVHSDAAGTGIPLALSDDPPPFDLSDGADSISLSENTIIGLPMPAGILVTRRQHAVPDPTGRGRGCDAVDARSGLARIMLWYATARLGRRGLRERVQHGAELAAYTEQRLHDVGWPRWRRPGALAVVLTTPPPSVRARWILLTAHGLSRIICHPGITCQHIDEFVADLAPHAYSVSHDGVAVPGLLSEATRGTRHA